MRKASSAISARNDTAYGHHTSGADPAAYTTAATIAAPAGIGRPTKYFRPGRPGLLGFGSTVMLNREMCIRDSSLTASTLKT